MRYKNNPFNIRFSPENNWKGQIEPSNGFCQFSDLKYGFRAAFIIIFNYKNLHDCKTIGEIIARWAPPSENNTSAYRDFIANLLDPSTELSGTSDLILLMYGMYCVEQGVRPDLIDFVSVLNQSVVTD